jgi:hypothetical protein
MSADPELAGELARAGYAGLFLAGDHSASGAVWRDGDSRDALMGVVQDEQADELVRLLASEVLYRHDPGYPPDGWSATLAPVYARALALTGDHAAGLPLTGNEWGFLYREAGPDGELGTHLLATGREAVPHLSALLDDANRILYVGSHDATLGNSLHYRVKDAAAYFIGKATGTAVRFHDDPAERDAEIERLRGTL